MKELSRRDFTKLCSVSALGMALPNIPFAQEKPSKEYVSSHLIETKYGDTLKLTVKKYPMKVIVGENEVTIFAMNGLHKAEIKFIKHENVLENTKAAYGLRIPNDTCNPENNKIIHKSLRHLTCPVAIAAPMDLSGKNCEYFILGGRNHHVSIEYPDLCLELTWEDNTQSLKFEHNFYAHYFFWR